MKGGFELIAFCLLQMLERAIDVAALPRADNLTGARIPGDHADAFFILAIDV